MAISSGTRHPLGRSFEPGSVAQRAVFGCSLATPRPPPIAKHNVVPPYRGNAVTWRLKQHA